MSTYKSREAYQEAKRLELVARGERAIAAQYDNRGDCFTCGECGRCPGYHSEAEERASAEKARGWMLTRTQAMSLPHYGGR